MKRFGLFLLSIFITFSPIFTATHAVALGANLIPNASVEVQNSKNTALPASWTKDQWGSSTRTLTYDKIATNAADGTKSLYAEIKTYKTGDVKWSHKEVAVAASTSYTFSDSYRSNIASEIIVQTKSTTGTYTYQTLKAPAISATWAQNSIAFTTAKNAKAVTIFHLINKVGWIYTDNYYLGLTGPPVATIPTVTLTAPAASAVLSNTAVVSATASDASGIAGVQFKLDGANLGTEVIAVPYSINWDTRTSINGVHSITAVARSKAAATNTSAAVTVTVNNVPLPSAVITSPLAAATVSDTTTITTDATDTVGIQFKLDGVALGTEVTTLPFTTNWDTTTTPNGQHTLSAVARNSSNQTITTLSVPVTVTNVVTPPITPPATINLLANPSLETADPANNTKPVAWSNGGWGTNTATYTYETNGHTGTRSVTTKVTGYTSGDAKWYFAPVDVSGDKTYDYSHYFKSTVSTDVVAQYTDANGKDSYTYLATVAPSATWQLFAAQITPPATAKKMTILHVIYSVGSLQVDDASLALAVPAPADNAIIKNGSFETPSAGNTSLPAGWETGSWGTNTPLYEYLSEAYTGARSVKLTLTNYVDGDAKWFFTPVSSLSSGKMYRFSTKYKTNTIPKAVAQFERTDGSTLFFGMPNPQPNGTSDWQSYSDTFTVPEGVKAVTVFLLLNNNGYVQMDDASIVDYTPVGFDRPLLSLTFDDGFEENNLTVLPMTAAYGFKTTQCYATSFVQENSSNPQRVLEFQAAGHEICSHTITHPFLTSLSNAQLTSELADSQAYLKTITGSSVENFASPYGDYNESVNNEIKKYYRSHRTVDEGFNSKDNFDIYRIRVQNILSTTTATQVASWIAQAKATNTWLVLVYHRVGASDIGEFDTYTADFAKQLKAISDSAITVKTYGSALDELTAQL